MAKDHSIDILDSFAKAKDMPTAGRVSGGGVRTVYYRHPSRVKVIRGRAVNGTRAAGYKHPS